MIKHRAMNASQPRAFDAANADAANANADAVTHGAGANGANDDDDEDGLLLSREMALAEYGDDIFLGFLLVACPLVLVALFSNSLAFAVFYKKSVFRKILSNRY